jgi:hypothetical protein
MDAMWLWTNSPRGAGVTSTCMLGEGCAHVMVFMELPLEESIINDQRFSSVEIVLQGLLVSQALLDVNA